MTAFSTAVTLSLADCQCGCQCLVATADDLLATNLELKPTYPLYYYLSYDRSFLALHETTQSAMLRIGKGTFDDVNKR